jgi:hypothetical protein
VRVAPLFTLNITHEYFDDICPDVEVVLAKESLRVARHGRLMLRRSAGTLAVLFEQTLEADAVMSITGETVRLAIQTANPLARRVAESQPFVNRGPIHFHNRRSFGRLEIDPHAYRVPAERIGVIATVDIVIASDFYRTPPAFAIKLGTHRERPTQPQRTYGRLRYLSMNTLT